MTDQLTQWREIEMLADTHLKARHRINKLARAADESHLWPVRNRFNVTERAIRRVRALESQAGPFDSYADVLHDEIGRIVNGEI